MLSVILAASLSPVFSLTALAVKTNSKPEQSQSQETGLKKTDSSESSGNEQSSQKTPTVTVQTSREKAKYTVTVVSEETGNTAVVKDVVEGTKVSDLLEKDILNLNQLDKPGFRFNRLTSHPLSKITDKDSKKRAEKYIADADKTDGTYIYSDTKIYAVYFRHVDDIEIELTAPVCGTETDTGGSDFSTQTNAPEFRCKTKGLDMTCGWTISDGNLQRFFDTGSYLSDPYTGSFEGGRKYHATFSVIAALGYYIDDSTAVAVNGEINRSLKAHSDKNEVSYSASIDTEIKAVHNEKNGKCTACKKTVKPAAAAVSSEEESTVSSAAESNTKISSDAEESSAASDAEEFKGYLLSILIPVFIILGVMLLIILVVKIISAVKNRTTEI